MPAAPSTRDRSLRPRVGSTWVSVQATLRKLSLPGKLRLTVVKNLRCFKVPLERNLAFPLCRQSESPPTSLTSLISAIKKHTLFWKDSITRERRIACRMPLAPGKLGFLASSSAPRSFQMRSFNCHQARETRSRILEKAQRRPLVNELAWTACSKIRLNLLIKSSKGFRENKTLTLQMVVKQQIPIPMQSPQTLFRPWFLDSQQTLIKESKPLITKLFSPAHLISTRS